MSNPTIIKHFFGSIENQQEFYGNRFSIDRYYKNSASKLFELLCNAQEFNGSSPFPFLAFYVILFQNRKTGEIVDTTLAWKEIFHVLTMENNLLLSSILNQVGREFFSIFFLQRMDGSFQLLLAYQGYKPNAKVNILHGCNVTIATNGNGDYKITKVSDLSREEIDRLCTHTDVVVSDESSQGEVRIHDIQQFPNLSAEVSEEDLSQVVSAEVSVEDLSQVDTAEISEEDPSQVVSAVVSEEDPSDLEKRIEDLKKEIELLQKLAKIKELEKERNLLKASLNKVSNESLIRKVPRSSWDVDSDTEEEEEVNDGVNAVSNEVSNEVSNGL